MIIAVFMYGNIIIFLENIAFIFFFYHLVTAPYIFYNFRSLLFLFFFRQSIYCTLHTTFESNSSLIGK